MKTAIEQLIDELEQAKEAALNQSKLSRLNKDDSSGADGMVVGYMSAIKKASEMLPIEKQQIVDAAADPFLGSRPECDAKQIGENYYKTTFNKWKT